MRKDKQTFSPAKRVSVIQNGVRKRVVRFRDILRWAVYNGHLEMVKLLSTLPALTDDYMGLEQLALHHDHLEILKFLKTLPVIGENKRAVSVKEYPIKFIYVIQWAVCEGHLEMVKLLTTLPALASDYVGLTRLAVRHNHLEVLKFLITPPAQGSFNVNSTLRWAARDGRFEMVKFLITLPDVKLTGRSYKTALNWAVKYAANLQIVRFLATFPGVNINASHEDWKIYCLEMLCDAMNIGHVEIVKFFLTIPGFDDILEDCARRWDVGLYSEEMTEFLSTHQAEEHARNFLRKITANNE